MKFQRWKVKTFWILAVLSMLILSIAYHVVNNYVFVLSTTRYRLIENSNFVTNKNSSKIYVLFWTKMFGAETWYMPSVTNDEDYLKSIDCPVTNCILTHDKNLLEAPHLYDALIFHSAEPWLSPLPETRSPHQYYIMTTLEAPPELKHNLRLDANYFNLTMTYRLDSDILWSYGKIIDKRTNKVLAPDRNVEWRNPESVEDKDIHSLVSMKTKAAAWFVSHCNTHSKRENLVDEIQNFINVDIYGSCGPLECPRNSNACDAMINTTYYFYFSFENGICNDYVTEKFYKMMNLYAVPVVFNGVKDMNNFAPPKSYIDANDFTDAEKLADYLKYLIDNPKEYMNYFWWRKYYDAVFPADKYTHCSICKKLNEMVNEDRGQYYINISNWFYKNSCRKPKIKFY
ncbi:alpha-(1,3)-fucosyltransferase C-like [Chironomus tepperi]|uniref:alpha-(1,3)-fucosyltransferase C-like n=1 Tax=Chironomus tepperi TaxID=113505 RepID=UPI00391F599B